MEVKQATDCTGNAGKFKCGARSPLRGVPRALSRPALTALLVLLPLAVTVGGLRGGSGGGGFRGRAFVGCSADTWPRTPWFCLRLSPATSRLPRVACHETCGRQLRSTPGPHRTATALVAALQPGAGASGDGAEGDDDRSQPHGPGPVPPAPVNPLMRRAMQIRRDRVDLRGAATDQNASSAQPASTSAALPAPGADLAVNASASATTAVPTPRDDTELVLAASSRRGLPRPGRRPRGRPPRAPKPLKKQIGMEGLEEITEEEQLLFGKMFQAEVEGEEEVVSDGTKRSRWMGVEADLTSVAGEVSGEETLVVGQDRGRLDIPTANHEQIQRFLQLPSDGDEYAYSGILPPTSASSSPPAASPSTSASQTLQELQDLPFVKRITRSRGGESQARRVPGEPILEDSDDAELGEEEPFEDLPDFDDVLAELELLKETVAQMLRERQELLEAFAQNAPTIDPSDGEAQRFLDAAELVLERAGGSATQMVFGTFWKKMYPEWPLKPFLAARFKRAPSVARLLKMSDRFVVTTEEGNGRSRFWLPACYASEHPSLEQASDLLTADAIKERETIARGQIRDDIVKAIDLLDKSDPLAAPLGELFAQDTTITETQAWRDVYHEMELLREELARFQVGLPVRIDEREEEEGDRRS